MNTASTLPPGVTPLRAPSAVAIPTGELPEHLTAVTASFELLGLVMSYPEARAAATALDPSCHYDGMTQTLHRIAMAMHAEGADPIPEALVMRLTPVEAERLADYGGPSCLSSLWARAGNPGRARGLIEAIQRAHYQRSWHAWAADVVEVTKNNGDMSEVLGRMEALKATSTAGRFVLEYLSDIAPSPGEWLIPDLVPLEGTGFLSAESGAGKSFFALDIAARKAYGLPVLGREGPPSGTVYIAAEGASGVRKRISAWKARNNKKDRAPFAMIGAPPDLQSNEDVAFIIRSAKDAAKNFATDGHRLGLIVIDTLSQAMPGAEENGAADMSRIMARVRTISKETGAFVLLVHHSGKDIARGMRGSSTLRAAADLWIEIAHKEGETLRVATVKKLKDGEDGEKFAFTLESVQFTHDGVEYRSCVPAYCPVPGEAAKPTKQIRLTDHEVIVLRALNQAWDNMGGKVPAPSDPGVKAGQMAIREAVVREVAKTIGLCGEGDEPDTVRKRFSRAMEGLIAHQKVRKSGGLIWPL